MAGSSPKNKTSLSIWTRESEDLLNLHEAHHVKMAEVGVGKDTLVPEG